MRSTPDILAQSAAPPCASEPIHVPGSIQPHGVLLLFDADSGRLARWAGKFHALLGTEPAAGSSAAELLGSPLSELIGTHPLVLGEEASYFGCITPRDRARLALQAHAPAAFALLAEGELVSGSGRIPAPDELRALAPLVEAHLKGRDSYWTDRLGEALPGAPPLPSTASGLMGVGLEASQALLALWFRPEQVEEINWAGDPGLKDAAADTFAPLSPRRSFATWRETVRGRSRPWMWYEINAADLFQSRVGYTLQRHRLKQVNAQLAEANEGLSALAATDPLTGLPNRRLFDERFQVEWQRASRQGQSLGLLAIDVDHFKQYNDRFGPPAGDECLKQVAGAIDAARRSADVAARVGGEEFAILLPGADADSAATVAERVRLAIEQLGLEHPQSAAGIVTISVGIPVCSPSGPADAPGLTIDADRALYTAKANGRNRVASSA